MTSSTYRKPFFTVEAQLDKLERNGMLLSDRDAARSVLQRIGYYRLSGYWYPYRAAMPGQPNRPSSNFRPGTTLDMILGLYAFDEQLRGALLAAIGQVEIALRFEIGHRLGRHGPFAHLETTQLDPAFTQRKPRRCNADGCSSVCTTEQSDHEGWLERQRNIEAVSTEAFAAHFHEHYGEPLPIWVATEVMSFGQLTRLLNGINPVERELLAAEWDILDVDGRGDASALTNWMEHLRQVRNICAHHSRVWNRNFNAVIEVPQGVPELRHLSERTMPVSEGTPSLGVRRVYGTFAVLTHVLAILGVPTSYRDRLHALLHSLIERRPEFASSLGFPVEWAEQPIMATTYERDQQRSEQARLLRQAQALGTSDAAALLTCREAGKPRRSLLNYYRKKGALLAVPWSARYLFPEFQFHEATGDILDIVIRANRRLLSGGEAEAEARWEALGWWFNPNSQAPDDQAPVELLRSGALTREILDTLLAPRDDEERES